MDASIIAHIAARTASAQASARIDALTPDLTTEAVLTVIAASLFALAALVPVVWHFLERFGITRFRFRLSRALLILLAGALTGIILVIVAETRAQDKRSDAAVQAQDVIAEAVEADYYVADVSPSAGDLDPGQVDDALSGDFTRAPDFDVLLTDGRILTFGVLYDDTTGSATLVADARDRVVIPADLERREVGGAPTAQTP